MTTRHVHEAGDQDDQEEEDQKNKKDKEEHQDQEEQEEQIPRSKAHPGGKEGRQLPLQHKPVGSDRQLL